MVSYRKICPPVIIIVAVLNEIVALYWIVLLKEKILSEGLTAQILLFRVYDLKGGKLRLNSGVNFCELYSTQRRREIYKMTMGNL